MEDRSLEMLDAGVDRLLNAYGRIKAENRELRDKLAEMESRNTVFKNRLDTIISRLEGAKAE